MSASVIGRVWRDSQGEPYAVDVRFSDGLGADIRLSDGAVQWADADVWACPERYGLERWFCPGHGGAVCQYGAHDLVRMAGGPPVLDLAGL